MNSKQSPTPLQIRTAVIPDAHALKALDTIVPFDPSRAEYIDRWLKEDTVLAAEIEGKIVGYGVFNHAFFHQGQVDMLMIHADYRGQRIGEAILSALEKLCDTPKFYVTTNMSNHRMQRLLSRMEYRAAGYIHELDPDDPELIFVKDIETAQY